VAQAMGGIIGITGPDADTPLKVGPGIGDIVPAMMTAFGALAAVLHARTTGRGQYVDVGMVDCVLALCERILHQYSYQQKVPRPEGNRHPLLVPFGMVPAQDGWVTIGCHRDPFWAELCRLMERPELIQDARFATNDDRMANIDAVYEAVAQYTRSRTKHELADRFGSRIPFGPVYDVRDIAEDPHFRIRGMVVDVEHPGLDAPMQIAGVPIRMSETPGGVHRRAPLVGEDTEAILRGIGCSDADIAAWRAAKVVL
jgi:crotonobetainyl-CoA:carnitine CoA-transferase CaiB-like acyl-CoA transferase